MLFERRFYGGLIAGGLLGVIFGMMLAPRRETGRDDDDYVSGARRMGQRVTGWLKK